MGSKPLTEEQITQCLDAIREHGTISAAARSLDMPRETLSARIRIIKAMAAEGRIGAIDVSHIVTPGYAIKGTSTLIDADGGVKQQWVKTDRKKEEEHEAFLEIAEAMAVKCKGSYKPKKFVPSKQIVEDAICMLPIGDPHIGMYAWSKETGKDWDCDKAQAAFAAAVDNLISRSAPTKVGVIVNLGDFFHSDTMSNETWRSGHKLDVDGRWNRVLTLGVQIMQNMIETALRRYSEVQVVNVIGNHDDHTSQMLSVCLKARYYEEPRVVIHDTIRQHQYLRFGNNLFGFTHNPRKPEMLAQCMWADRQQDSGECDYKYWMTGHIHHVRKVEVGGQIIESFRTLAPGDAYAVGSGYRSGSDLQLIEYRLSGGERSRLMINADDL